MQEIRRSAKDRRIGDAGNHNRYLILLQKCTAKRQQMKRTIAVSSTFPLLETEPRTQKLISDLSFVSAQSFDVDGRVVSRGVWNAINSRHKSR